MDRRDRATLWNQHFSEPSGLSTVREKPPFVGDYAHFDWAAFTEFYRINGRLGADDLLSTESVIRSARVLFLDHHGMVGNLRAALIARAAGIPIVADFEGDNDPGFQELLGLVDHIVLPEKLAAKVTGKKVSPIGCGNALAQGVSRGRNYWRSCRKLVS
jgi:hypothetical protein